MVRVGVLAFTLLLSGCFPLPPVWDAGDAIYRIDFIEEGITTKEEVIAELGEPDTLEEVPDGTVFVYRGEATNVLTYAFFPIQHGTFNWKVQIEFDEDGLVHSVKSSKMRPVPEVIELPDSPHEREMAIRQHWFSLCQQAVEGRGYASSYVAFHFRYGWHPVEKDLVKAYLWYTFAVNRGDSSATGHRRDLESEMSVAEITEAEQLVREWQADPSDCELKAAQADN